MKILKPVGILLFLVMPFLFAHTGLAQQSTPAVAVTNVDDLTDAQIRQMLQEGQRAGLTDSQLIQTAQNRGLPASQVPKLQARINAVRSNTATPATNDTNVPDAPRTLNYEPETPPQTTNISANGQLKVFGADLFRNANSSFQPNLKLATPVNYILGPDDQVNVSVYGNSVVNWKLNVTPEGNINLPSGGIVNVAGKTVEQATSLIRSRLISKNYAIGSGSSLKVTLGDIRSIKVIMVGEVVKPGTYTLPSLATAFNALYSAGGPNDNGSFRKIEIIRNNRIIRRLDIYDFLVRGSQQDNIGLQDQDIIRVPTYGTIVEMRGEIKTPAIFEVLPGETLADVIRFGGGFTNLAYRANVKVSQISDKQRRISDITEGNFKNYLPLPGDIFTIDRILDRYENRVTINGAVVRAGDFELVKNMTLSQLIAKASGLREDAFTQRGTITRLNADNTTQLISFNVVDVINKTADVTLQREDVVSIQSIFDLRDKYVVKISGQVRNPGDYAYADSMKVENLILMAGGFAEGASRMRVEVARRVYDGNPASKSSATARVYTIDLGDELRPDAADFTLKPYDIVLVYPLPGFEKQGMVYINGEATYPGPYVIAHKGERISDLIKRAGGLTAAADADGSTLKRNYTAILGINSTKTDTTAFKRNRIQQVGNIKQGFNDTTRSVAQARNSFIGINLRQILDKPGSETDLIIKDGDVITVPQEQQVVQVSGEVHVPSGVVYSSGKSFKDYVNNAGGFSNDALKKGSYVIYPNGTVKGTRKFLFFNNYPAVKPGSEIVVPQRPARRPFSFGEFAAIISALGTTVILAIVSLKN